MISESRQHRLSRRRVGVVLRPRAVGRARPVQVSIQLTDFATSNTQSFLIMNGDTLKVTLTGYTLQPGPEVRVLHVPLTIRVN